MSENGWWGGRDASSTSLPPGFAPEIGYKVQLFGGDETPSLSIFAACSHPCGVVRISFQRLASAFRNNLVNERYQLTIALNS